MRRAPGLAEALGVLALGVAAWGCAPPGWGSVALAAPSLVWALAARLDFRRTFYLRPLPVRSWGPVLCVAVGAPAVAGSTFFAQTFLLRGLGFDFAPQMEGLERVVRDLPLVSVTLLPAVCEEILFRGVLLSAFALAFSRGRGVVYTALLFGAIHVLVPRMIPMTLLGLAFGALTVMTGSVLAGMVAHLANNLIAMALSCAGLSDAAVATLFAIAALPGAALAAVGFAWLRRRQGAGG